MITDELKEILAKQNFTNFWIMFEYLAMNGYDSIDCLGISLSYFGEDAVWGNVAFVKIFNFVKRHSGDYMLFAEREAYFNGELVKWTETSGLKEPTIFASLEISIIDESNLHLRGLYEYANKQRDLENNKNITVDTLANTVETRVRVNEIDKFLFDYLIYLSKKQLGYNILNVIVPDKSKMVMGYDPIN